MSGKRYYGYQGYSGHRRSSEPTDGLFGWTIFIFILIGFVFLCWMGSYYIFAHPEKATNYRLLLRMHKIEPPTRFEVTAAPRGEFLKPGQLLERFGSMTSSEIRRNNENLLRNFVRNFHQNRDLVPYAVGTYRVIGTAPLSEKTFCPSGITALLQAVEQPEVLLEQLFTADEKNISSLQRALVAGQEIKLEKPLDLSAVVHIERLPDNRILLTTMPLLYGSYGAGKGGQPSFSLEPPAEINLDAPPSVLSAPQIEEITGGKVAKPKDLNSLRLRRITEEMPPQETPVARALPVTPSGTGEGKPPTSLNEPTVARSIPVNAPAVMAAIPVGTPLTKDIPRAIPVGAIPVGAAPPTTSFPIAVPASTPLATPLPTPGATPQTLSKSTPTQAVMPAPATFPTPPPVTNQIAAPSEVWPVYTAGQMPRGRLVESTDSQELAARGVGGERNYLKGRFSVTASGNGRAVLRPQGAIAGVPMGASGKVRVIVEFPAGAVPPSEGNIISRDNLRPFQITSVKKGDDGQINIYAREITRGQ
ncbi:MAG: hypothetical protein K8R38_02385 [Verrucomicrobia bacterium]|nr:hypothetical protein [Verrucomicrobiota bacterium]